MEACGSEPPLLPCGVQPVMALPVILYPRCVLPEDGYFRGRLWGEGPCELDCDNSKLESNHFPWELAVFRGETRALPFRELSPISAWLSLRWPPRKLTGSLGNYRVKWIEYVSEGNM